jgi:hypothetical protein
MKVFNEQSFSNYSQSLVGCIAESDSNHIVMRSDPFPFQYSPKCFCDIQMRGIGRLIEKGKTDDDEDDVVVVDEIFKSKSVKVKY